MPKKEIEVEWFEKELPLNQIYQPTQMQFAFVTAPKDGNKQCHPFVLCRDYLHDAVKCSYYKTECTVYGFTYRYGDNPPLDLKYTRMLVTKKGLAKNQLASFDNKMKLALRILHNYEALAGWRKSRLFKVKGREDKVWLFVSTNMWMKSPFLISMYTFLIRLSDKYSKFDGFTDNNDLKKRLRELSESNDSNDNDSKYIVHMWDKLDLVIEKRDKLLFADGKPDTAYKYDGGIGTFHNCSGILSLCKFSTPDSKRNDLAKTLLTVKPVEADKANKK